MKPKSYLLILTASIVSLFVSVSVAIAAQTVYFHRSDTTIAQNHADAMFCGDATRQKMPDVDASETEFIREAIKCMRSKGYGFGFFPECESRAVSKNLVPILRDKSRPPRDGACVIQVTSRAGNLVYADEQ